MVNGSGLDWFDSGLLELERRTSHAVPTGLADLDRVTGGLGPGQLWFVAGPRGVGRTTLAVTLACAAALSAGEPTALLAPRGDAANLAARLAGAYARVPVQALLHGRARDPATNRRLEMFRSAFAAAPLSVRTEVTADSLAELAEDVRVVIVDDVDGVNDKGARQALVAAAHEADTTVVVTRPSWPLFADLPRPWLREADVVIRLHRPDRCDPLANRVGEIDMHLVHSRFSPTCIVTAAFHGHYSLIEDLRAGR